MSENQRTLENLLVDEQKVASCPLYRSRYEQIR